MLRRDVSPRIAARSLWGALDGLALTWALGTPERKPDPATLRKAATQFATLFLSWLADPIGVAMSMGGVTAMMC